MSGIFPTRNALTALSVAVICLVGFTPTSAQAICGDGIVDANESCDPGLAEHPLHHFGDTRLPACPEAGGSICFFSNSCCKWNCQDVGDSDVVCSDANPCDIRYCDQFSQCSISQIQPAGTACDDNLFCTGTDTCDGRGSCSVHEGDPCPGTECNGCQEDTDTCFDPEGTRCSGADPGNCEVGTCNGSGSCSGTAPADDGTPCDDGVFCNGADTCTADGCTEHAGDPCPGTDCNTCQEDLDSCFEPAGTACTDDGNVCTDDQCNGEGGCERLNNTQFCEDGSFCNGPDRCSGGVCASMGFDPCDDEVGCTVDTCDDSLDTCANEPADDNCSDGLFCNGTEVCDAEQGCVGGPYPCDDENGCTTDNCDEESDGCSFDPVPEPAICDDGDVCTLDDQCIGGECTGTAPLFGDLCPWGLLTNDTNPKSKDKLRVGVRSEIVGDFCGGLIIVGDNSVNDSTVVSAKSGKKAAMRIGEKAVIMDDIITAGAGVQGKPASVPLPALDVGRLAGGTVMAKPDDSGVYDLSGEHPTAADCLKARAAFTQASTAFRDLPSDGDLGEIRIKGEQTYAINAKNVGGLNVFDFKRILAGRDIVFDINGGGDPNTIVILRAQKLIKLGGRGTIRLSGGLTPEHVIIHVLGRKCHLGDKYTGAGTMLCEGKIKIGDRLDWNGVLFAGNKKLEVGEESKITYNPFRGF